MNSTTTITPVASPYDSLSDIVKRRLLVDVIGASTKLTKSWMVLVVDDAAMKVLSAAIGMYDLMELRVSIVSGLQVKRAPYPDMGVIYFIDNDSKSVDSLIRDWATSGRKKMYGGPAFIYTLSELSDDNFEKIKQCKPLMSKLKGLTEVNIDFLVNESRVFNFGMRDYYGSLFSSNHSNNNSFTTDTRMSAQGFHFNDYELKIARKLVCLCATLNEYPHVRYPANSNVCRAIAEKFQQAMNAFVGQSPSWWYYGMEGHTQRDRAVLLLLDRTHDSVSPLIHEFTYQAMVYDLLTVQGEKISYTTETKGGEHMTKDALLNDNDHLWVEMKHRHIAEVVEEIGNRINEFIGSNAGAVMNNTGQQLSLDEMADALKGLPQYREALSKLSEHMTLADKCLKTFNVEKLLDVAEIEQTLATGATEAGKKASLSTLVSQMEGLLPQLTSEVALRLIAIFIVSQQGKMKQDTKASLLSRAQGLTNEDKQFLEKLDHFVKESSSSPSSENSKAGKKKGMFSRLTTKVSTSVSGRGGRDSEYSSSRYVPYWRDVVENLSKDNLDFDTYPSLLPMPMGGQGVATTARRKKKKANDKTRVFTGARQIVFGVGGVTYSEVREMGDLLNSGEKEIIIGGTSILTPATFVEEIQNQ